MTFTFDDFKARFFQAGPLAGRTAPEPPAAVALQDNPLPNGLGDRRRAARPSAGADSLDGLPISAILAAIKADPAALHRRRAVLEGEIRSVWSTLQELVREYRALGDDAILPQDVSPTLPAKATKASNGLPKEMAALGDAIGLSLSVLPAAASAPAPVPVAVDQGGLFAVDDDVPVAKAEAVRLPRSRAMVRPARRQAR
ncbi:hypothetical protein [Nitrospirillum sp. BR 11828]|uniref:hypothetical protein n=1 Tax=Nitrospirillum sp. BR 11828 TaxID=3104325 RepID=UPI002ACA8B54|nr:hypothetical protein [Nitrospirillum sp. BR 11828]MDZ5646229.1 hypothetical protein [Nitrospirillum sp. BR 11828]